MNQIINIDKNLFMTTPFVKAETKNGCTTVEFFHPHHNSLPGDLLERLRNEILSAGKNPECKVILLKSGGDRTFCAGANFDELLAIENPDQGKKFFMGFAGVINAIRTCGKIVVGRVQGKTVGGGVGLASAVDYCIASKWASVRLSELVIGIGPFVIGPAVERKIGVSDFAKMSLTPEEWQTAQWAKEKGLFHEVFETVDQVDEYCDHLCQKLCNYNPQALKDLKKVFWEDTAHWDELLEARAAMSGTLVLDKFTKSYIDKFRTA